ncbi:MAG: glycine cleavage system protein GcvH [Bacteroidetes bacterium]|nr:glycine cleavage system protein GcvH [Bacteroidota bacterium]
MNFPADLKYTKDHEWIRVTGDTATVGITDFAQRELGDIVYVEIETEGEDLASGDTFGTVEAVKTVADLYMPISGQVSEINPDLEENPDLVNTDPYGKGWMAKIILSRPAEVGDLMDADAYAALVG